MELQAARLCFLPYLQTIGLFTHWEASSVAKLAKGSGRLNPLRWGHLAAPTRPSNKWLLFSYVDGLNLGCGVNWGVSTVCRWLIPLCLRLLVLSSTRVSAPLGRWWADFVKCSLAVLIKVTAGVTSSKGPVDELNFTEFMISDKEEQQRYFQVVEAASTRRWLQIFSGLYLVEAVWCLPADPKCIRGRK